MKSYVATVVGAAVVGLVGLLGGCSQGPSEESKSAAPEVDGAKYLIADEPEGANDVIKVRENAKDGDDVVIVGRIGGNANPWVDKKAAFFIVDGSLKACSDIPGDGCTQPWDYCCETSKLPQSMVLVKVVDENGEVVLADAKQLLPVKELSTVVVRGKAQRDESGNLIVLAHGVYVKKK